ncbi:hypothetical protein GCM10027443_07130 [Pontibacter brevis]
MKDFANKPAYLNKVEFWAATTIFVFAVFFLITSAVSSDKSLFDEESVSFNYYQNLFFPQLIRYIIYYVGFLLLNFIVVPNLLRKEALFQSLLLILAVFLVVGVVFGVTDTYTKSYLLNRYNTLQEAYNVIFHNSFLYALWLLFMFGFYTSLKYAGIYLLSNSEAIQTKYRFVTPGGLTAFVLWMISMFLMLMVNAPTDLIVAWGIVIPSGIFLYSYSFYAFIPKSLPKKHPFRNYLLKSALVLIISIPIVALLIQILTEDEDAAISIALFNVAFQLLITVPLTWVLFKRHLKGNEELYVLKKELGRSNANLDFLRSQINPHFLFNALNTLYGTALQENSERTAQGIQMLGDMMRFMLHENHQHKILLSREIEYMRNYIELQSLRISNSPDIVIHTKIEDVVADKFIAPMLLIPFVENAFKHGISLKHKSWIKVMLHYKQDKLFFDVYNSTHPKQEKDPEKEMSGIGLENVRQRLEMLYPGKHELVIRETLEDYFVHLTIQL